MRADIWTDVVQWILYLLGALVAAALIGSHVAGGWGSIFAHAGDHLKIFDLSLHLDRPHTLWAGLLGGGLLSMASHGVDQLIVQRLLASRGLRDARIALIGSGVVVTFQMALFLLLGVGLNAYFEGRAFAVPDQIFPTFIIERMPPGLSGLLVAAILAATMGNLSSALNALSAASTIDLYCPIRGVSEKDESTLRVRKRFTLLWAFLVIGGSFLFLGARTSVVTVALSIASIASGALLGTFLLGLYWKRSSQKDAITALALGLVAMTLIQFKLKGIGWPWFALIGTTITFSAGAISSLVRPLDPVQKLRQMG
jgi:Na+/proline symporter